MLNHLRLRHPQSISEGSVTARQAQITQFTRPRTCDPLKAERISEVIAEMIARDCLRIRTVEGDGFRQLLPFIEPNYKVPSWPSVLNRIHGLYDTVKTNLQEAPDKATHVSLAIDCWTSRARFLHFVSHHYITDKWEFKTAVLCTKEIEECHTSDILANFVQNVAESWNLHGKVVAVVHANASNMQRLGEMSCNAQDLGCTAHSLQLAVQAGLKTDRISVKPLYCAITALSGETTSNMFASFIHPLMHGLISNHLVVSNEDLPSIKTFKWLRIEEIRTRFEITDAQSVSMLSAVLDPRYKSLEFTDHIYLTVPATSVPFERLFSKAGNIVTKLRSSLGPENVDKLVFLHKNLKSGFYR
ncbi:ZBED4 protein, partial [Polyodon spathula]|nr:ZBED4 protein [Polyodon spathula]